MKILDRVLACLIGVGGILHGVGSYLGYKHEPVTMLWAFSASLFSLLVAAINLLRASRPADRPLAWIAFAGSLALAASAFSFGALIGNVFDPRALANSVAALALAGFSLKTALREAQAQA
jgi:Na+-translocating ferredoxin:NAD+ oxidoreductase RnfD subunit